MQALNLVVSLCLKGFPVVDDFNFFPFIFATNTASFFLLLLINTTSINHFFSIALGEEGNTIVLHHAELFMDV